MILVDGNFKVMFTNRCCVELLIAQGHGADSSWFGVFRKHGDHQWTTVVI